MMTDLDSDELFQTIDDGHNIFTFLTQKGHLLVTPCVDLLMQNSKDFYTEISEKVESHQVKLITIDFNEVNFVDSSGAGAIIRVANTIRLKGMDLFVVNLNKNLSSVFRLSGFPRLMKICTYEEYIALFPEMKSVIK